MRPVSLQTNWDPFSQINYLFASKTIKKTDNQKQRPLRKLFLCSNPLFSLSKHSSVNRKLECGVDNHRRKLVFKALCMLLRNTRYAVSLSAVCLSCFVFVWILLKCPLLPISASPSTTTTLNRESLCTITHQSPPVTLTFSDSHGRVYSLKNGTTPPSAWTTMGSSTCSLHSLRPMEEFLSGGSHYFSTYYKRSIGHPDLKDKICFVRI